MVIILENCYLHHDRVIKIKVDEEIVRRRPRWMCLMLLCVGWVKPAL